MTLSYYKVAAVGFWLMFRNHKALMSLMEKRVILLNAFLCIVYCIAHWEVNLRIQGIMEQICLLWNWRIFNCCGMTILRVFSSLLTRLEFLEFHRTQIRLSLALCWNWSNSPWSKWHHRLCFYYSRRHYFSLGLVLADSLWLYL